MIKLRLILIALIVLAIITTIASAVRPKSDGGYDRHTSTCHTKRNGRKRKRNCLPALGGGRKGGSNYKPPDGAHKSGNHPASTPAMGNPPTIGNPALDHPAFDHPTYGSPK
ncbi:5294_t:CDS:2 [Paraglomus occultum]|uniref:5294_t:CDS:1 n=1 Tax=Paraglomus occultum TaxID=144539 RepID=A0A9N9B1B6_9GLOM|nr:5294_t:CDS:2 [Paraglomus occultum]